MFTDSAPKFPISIHSSVSAPRGFARTSVMRTEGEETSSFAEASEDREEAEEAEEESEGSEESEENEEPEEEVEEDREVSDEESEDSDDAKVTEDDAPEDSESEEEDEEIDGRTPGVPKIGGPGSKPDDSVAVLQFSGTFPGAARSTRSMLALGPPEGFAPANGLPTPSSTSSRTAPLASTSFKRSLVFGRLMADVTIHGSAARRDDGAA
jgi:hypothetical protein